MNVRPTRRSFLKSAGAAATVPLVWPRELLAVSRQKSASAFAPEIGVCTSTKNADVLRASGADYIEVGARRFLMPDKPDAEFAPNLKAAKECGLPIRSANGFLPGSLKSTGPEANHQGVLKYAQTAFQRAKQVGIKVIVFGSSGSRTPPKGFDLTKAEEQFVALLKKMGPLAEPHGVIVAIEPLQKKETRFINTVTHGAKIVRAVKHPNIQLLADIFHMMRMDEPPKSIRDAGDLLEHVHIAEKAQRTPPGVDGDDFTAYFQALEDIGYQGRISIECRWENLSKQLPVAVKTMRAQMGKVN